MPSHRLALALSTAAVLAIGGTTVAQASSTPPAATHWLSGVYVGAGQSAQDQAFGTWRGAPITSATDFLPDNTWSDYESNAGWWTSQWAQAPGVRVSFSVGAWPLHDGTTYTLAEAGSGEFDTYYTALAKQLVAGGQASATLRFAWDFNSTEFPWQVQNATEAAQYAQMWQQFVDSVRSVPGEHFTFDWCLYNNGWDHGVNLALAYPGNSYVDDIGDDVFDVDWSHGGVNSPQQRWSDLQTLAGDGMDWQVAFAAQQGKPVSYPEWAETHLLSSGQEVGGADDPSFVQDMDTWFSTHDTAYEDYFDVDYSATNAHALADGQFPQSAALYQQLFGASTVTAAAPASTPAPAQSTSELAPGMLSGVYVASGEPAEDEAFGTWRGSPLTSATDYLAHDNWGDYTSNVTWWTGQWAQAPGVKVSFSVAPWPTDDGNTYTLAEAASGQFDTYYTALARNLVAGGQGDAILRFAWEFNGNWFPWQVQNATEAAQYAQMWVQFVDSVRSVPGEHFTFDWCISNNAWDNYTNLALAYPGDAYVDDIGDDVYDWDWANGGVNTPAQRWSDLQTLNGDGLAWQASFAAAHGKQLSFPEWAEAVLMNGSQDVGGGDDPLFMQNMYTWFTTHDTAYQNYFDVNDSSTELHQLNGGSFPQSAALYQRLFG